MFKKKNKIQALGDLSPSKFLKSSKLERFLLLLILCALSVSLLIDEISNSVALYYNGTVHKVESTTLLKTYEKYEGYKDRIHIYNFRLADRRIVPIALANKINKNTKIRYLVWLKGTDIGGYSESEPALLEYLGGRDAISNIIFLSVLSLFWLGCALYVFKKKESLYPNQELRHVF